MAHSFPVTLPVNLHPQAAQVVARNKQSCLPARAGGIRIARLIIALQRKGVDGNEIRLGKIERPLPPASVLKDVYHHPRLR
jgi:hypothetical protein